MEIVFGIVLLVMALFLIVAVLMQSGKSHGLSGSIAGGAETFFGKEQGKRWDKLLSKLTTVVAIIFVVVVLVAFVLFAPDTGITVDNSDHDHDTSVTTDVVEGSDTAAPDTDTAAPDTGDETAAAGEDTAA